MAATKTTAATAATAATVATTITRATFSGFFADKNVLITGGSGFLGKLLVCKLLTSCQDLGRVHLLLRPKRAKKKNRRRRRGTGKEEVKCQWNFDVCRKFSFLTLYQCFYNIAPWIRRRRRTSC